MLTFDAFVQVVRHRLSILGLPMNWQPSRESLHPFHAAGVTPERAANYYQSAIDRYNRFTQRGRN